MIREKINLFPFNGKKNYCFFFFFFFFLCVCVKTKKNHVMCWKYQLYHSCYALVGLQIFLTHSIKYIWYSSQKSKYPLFIPRSEINAYLKADKSDIVYSEKISYFSTSDEYDSYF